MSLDINTLNKVITTVGYIEAVIFIGFITYTIYLWATGILPVLIRLGNGLAKRKIAIFAKGNNTSSLKNLILDSKLFKEKNIYEITRKQDIGRAESATMYLVFWHDWSDDIDDILRQKTDKCSLIVYAPYDQGRIPDDRMRDLDGKRHTTVTNFRGRLLNDIVASMITTGYEKE